MLKIPGKKGAEIFPHVLNESDVWRYFPKPRPLPAEHVLSTSQTRIRRLHCILHHCCNLYSSLYLYTCTKHCTRLLYPLLNLLERPAYGKSVASFALDRDPPQSTVFRLHRAAVGPQWKTQGVQQLPVTTVSFTATKRNRIRLFASTSTGRAGIIRTPTKAWERNLSTMFYIYWPLIAFLTLFLVVGTIMVLLRFGPVICRTRHVTLPDRDDWQHRIYSQHIGFESLA